MYKRVIKYEDYDGNPRTEDCYFNFNKSELTRYNLSTNGGILALMNQVVSEQDGKKLCAIFEEIILGAYGEKSLDGREFRKSAEISERFKSTLAYDQLFNELSTDAKKFAEFMNNIIPAESRQTEDKLDELVAQATSSL